MEMGLDMYLIGDAYLQKYSNTGEPIERPQFDGKPIKSYLIELGY
jgi:hypothetical protein